MQTLTVDLGVADTAERVRAGVAASGLSVPAASSSFVRSVPLGIAFSMPNPSRVAVTCGCSTRLPSFDSEKLVITVPRDMPWSSFLTQ